MSDDLVTRTLHSLEGLDAYVRALDDYNDALVAANEELEAKLAKAVEALDEAVYLLAPNESDMEKEAGVYRVVTTIEELKDPPADS